MSYFVCFGVATPDTRYQELVNLSGVYRKMELALESSVESEPVVAKLAFQG